MINQGSKATTDSGDSGGIALSGGLWSTCEGRRIPTAPRPPNADFRDALSKRAGKQKAHFEHVLSKAMANRYTSERAEVLLSNYSHQVRVLNIVEWLS